MLSPEFTVRADALYVYSALYAVWLVGVVFLSGKLIRDFVVDWVYPAAQMQGVHMGNVPIIKLGALRDGAGIISRVVMDC